MVAGLPRKLIIINNTHVTRSIVLSVTGRVGGLDDPFSVENRLIL